MGTVLGMYAGSCIGGPPGAALGGLIGSFVDQQVFGRGKKADGLQPSFDGLKLQGANEGAGIPFVLGRENRVQGSVIWISEIIEREVEGESGGKGGGGDDVVIGFEYFVNIAIAFGENLAGDIATFDRIWANGNVWYQRTNELTLTGDFSVEIFTQPLFGTRMEVVAEAGQDLTRLFTNTDTDLSGFVNGANNGTFKCTSVFTRGDGKTAARFINDVAIAEGAVDAIVHQGLSDIRPGSAKSVRFYTGNRCTEDWVTFNPQVEDSLIASYEGADIPAFHGIAYIVIEELAITPYGNQIPQMTAEVDAEGVDITMQDAIQRLWGRTGRSLSEIDVTNVTDAFIFPIFHGMSFTGPTAPLEALRAIMIAGGVRCIEYGQVLYFYSYGTETPEVLERGLAGSYEGQGNRRRPLLFNSVDQSKLPTTCTVTYVDYAKSYNSGSQSDKAFNDTNGTDNTLSFDLPMSMRETQAKKIARRELWDAISQRERMQTRLPPSLNHIIPGDILDIDVPRTNDPDETDFERFRCLVTRRSRGANLLSEIEGAVIDSTTAHIGEQPDDQIDPPGQDDEIDSPPSTVLILADIAPLSDDVLSVPGFYWGTSAADRTATWRGAALFESPDDVDFEVLATTNVEARTGEATTVLAGGPTLWFDYEHSVTIRLYEGDLSSKAEEQVMNGQNWMLIASEIVGFTTATLIQDGVYTLSGLLRGLRDTEDEIGNHNVGDQVLILDSTKVRFQGMSAGEIGSTRYYRSVPAGGLVADEETVTLERQGNNLKPFAPGPVTGERNGANDDVIIRWSYRTRALVSFFQFQDVPVIEMSHTYELDIYDDNTFTTLVATRTVTDATELLYTEAMQLADGLILGNPVNLEIFQIGDYVGRGKGTRGVDL